MNTFVKLLFITGLLGLGSSLQAQIEIVGNNHKNANGTKKIKFKYTSAVADTITVKVVDPRGELQSVPVRNKTIKANQNIPLKFDPGHWQRGSYRIIVEGRNSGIVTRRLFIDEKTSRRTH